MLLIRIIIIISLSFICYKSHMEYKNITKLNYYNIVKSNKESMIEIFKINQRKDSFNDLLYCDNIKRYSYKQKIFDKGFLDTIFLSFNYGKYNTIYSKSDAIDIYYNNNDDFSFCISKINDYNYQEKKEQLFQYLPSNIKINRFDKCEGGHYLGKNRMFKIEDDKFVYCESKN